MGKDQLTQLDDRSAFYRVLTEQVNYVIKHKVKAGLLLVDIDALHKINAQYGYEVGDKILAKFGELLGTVKRPQDFLGRVGDNTFALLLMGVMNTGHAELAARKVLRLLDVPFSFKDYQIPVECTIAIAICPMHGQDARHLLKEAESVLRKAKQQGQKIATSKIGQDQELSDYWDIEMAIVDAIKFNEFSLHYQPKVDVQNGRVSGAEALLRWKHQSRGFVSPDIFIPIAEQTGMIKPITAWVLNTALRQAAKWPTRWGPQSVSVNIPPDFLLMPDFFDMVCSSLSLWKNDNVKLTLEIIERSFVSQVERTIDALHKLRDAGVKISIDDFGTGYSSLSYFEKLPVDEIKIDQSFVFNLAESKASRDIVKLIRDLGHAFGLQVVAEGVEDSRVLRYLHKSGCDLIQGYFYSKPLPNANYMEWLAKVQLPDLEKR
jgi:diguanylate cyclase (GGDEF)-like protein